MASLQLPGDADPHLGDQDPARVHRPRASCSTTSLSFISSWFRYVAVDGLSEAEQMSRADLEAAFGDGADSGLVAGRLKSAGYVAVDNFQIARDE
jgi:hypothetical protein